MKKPKLGRAWPVIACMGVLALGSAQAQKTVKLVTLGPLTGSLSALGQDIQKGAELAVQQRQKELQAAGLNVVFESYDDQADPAIGTKHAETILADGAVYGVVGALNSGVSLKAAEVFAKAPLAIISPTSTADKLTAQGWKHFFRVVAPDQAQGEMAADYIARTLKPQSVFVVTDNTTYGNGLSSQVRNALKAQNVKIAGSGGTYGENDHKALVTKIRESRADLVFFGGTPDKGGPLLKLMRDSGLKAGFMGGDAFDGDIIAKTAGSAAEGVLFTTVYGPVNSFANRGEFTRNYERAYKQEPSGFSAFSYDATNAMLDAFKIAAQKGANMKRQDIVDAMRKVNSAALSTVTGSIKFTTQGDRANSPLFIMRLEGANLEPRVAKIQRYVAPAK